ncbi:MAG TPA: hypothetical protein VHJ34_06665 [Actinomycetota bacterium]|nr:hypothetical protein [Actinomycetota bacterium]
MTGRLLDPMSRRLRLAVAVMLSAGLLAGTQRAADASGTSLTVGTWKVDTSTGVVTYDVTLRDVCDTSTCAWKIEAYHVRDGVAKAQATRAGDWETFGRLWNSWVKERITDDPTIVRREYWDC